PVGQVRHQLPVAPAPASVSRRRQCPLHAAAEHQGENCKDNRTHGCNFPLFREFRRLPSPMYARRSDMFDRTPKSSVVHGTTQSVNISLESRRLRGPHGRNVRMLQKWYTAIPRSSRAIPSKSLTQFARVLAFACWSRILAQGVVIGLPSYRTRARADTTAENTGTTNDCHRAIKYYVASAITNRWFDDEQVGAVVDMPNSAVALAVQKLAAARKRISVTVTGGSSRFDGQGLHQHRLPLGLRHLFQHGRHCTRYGRLRSRYLVFHHRRLCVR